MVSGQNNDALTKQIIELYEKKEREKIETLLEGILVNDPENIDILFRLAVLNMHTPFVDYSTSCIFLERVGVVCMKHRTIAESIISSEKIGLGFILKNAIYWFYAGKKQELINEQIRPLIEQVYKNGVFVDVPEKTRSFFENEFKHDPNNVEAMLFLASMEISEVRGINDEAARLLERIIESSKETEAKAMIFLAYLMNFSEIDDVLLSRLNSLQTKNDEINSMVKYIISFAYSSNRKDDIQLEEKYLRESVDLYQGHVSNCVRLAGIYRDQGKKTEAKQLVQKALTNVKKIYRDNDGSRNYDPTDINELLGQLVKGIYIPEANLEWIRELL